MLEDRLVLPVHRIFLPPDSYPRLPLMIQPHARIPHRIIQHTHSHHRQRGGLLDLNHRQYPPLPLPCPILILQYKLKIGLTTSTATGETPVDPVTRTLSERRFRQEVIDDIGECGLKDGLDTVLRSLGLPRRLCPGQAAHRPHMGQDALVNRLLDLTRPESITFEQSLKPD